MDIDNATLPVETDDETIKRLALLSPIEFDRCCEEAANKLGCKASTLEAEVRKSRGDGWNAIDNGQGKAFEFTDVEPWPESVNGADLLNELADIIKRYVVLPDEAAEAAALWVVHTYAYDLGRITPVLAIYSPAPRCGKSTLMALLARMAHKSLPASNISPSAVFRVIEKFAPTLLIDEADSFINRMKTCAGSLTVDIRAIWLSCGGVRVRITKYCPLVHGPLKQLL
jgi:putative DNA primase/helicase